MLFLDSCLLCGTFAGQKYARTHQDRWKGPVQELCVDDAGRLVNPKYSTRSQHMHVHHICWTIVEKVASRGQYDACWLEDFRKCLWDLGPLLQHAKCKAAPQPSKTDLQALTNHEPMVPPASLPEASRLLSLPPELLDHVYFFLTDFSDVDGFRIATARDPPITAWKSLWRKYEGWGPICDTNKLALVLRNLEDISLQSLWPHASTFTAIWKNTELVLKFYRQSRYGSVDHCEHRPLSVQSSEIKHQNVYCLVHNIEFKPSISLKLRFNRVYDRQYLCGITYDEHTIGYKGDETATIILKRWTGLRLISDGYGFVSVQARDMLEWRDADATYRGHNLKSDLTHCDIGWDKESTRGKIVLSIDTFKINVVSIIPSPVLGARSIMWQSSIPPEYLEPTTLVNRCAAEQHCTYWHLERIENLNSITAFVNVEDVSIVAFEFQYNDGRISSAGNERVGTVRLSHYLKEEEVITSIGCAKAVNHPGIAVKITTNFFPAGILFGDELAHTWYEVSRPRGVFFTSERDSTILSVFGVFCYPQDGSVEQNCGKVSITFPKSSIRTNPPQQVFLSEASLRGVSEIIIFSKDYLPGSTILCGLKVIYSSPNQVLLGEESKKCQSLKLVDPIRTISIYYIQCFNTQKLVTGLVISTKCKNFEIKCSDTLLVDILQIDEDSTLYWAFNHLYSCAALSKEEATKALVL